MDFTITEDQGLLRDSIRNFLMLEVTPELLRDLSETETARSQDLWAKFAEQGLTALSVPQTFGGMGCGDVDWVLLAQELGYYGVRDSLTSTGYLGASILDALPDGSKVKEGWLPRIVDGSARVAVGHPINPLVADAHVAKLLLMHHDGEVHAIEAGAAELVYNPSVDMMRRLYRVDWKSRKETCVADAEHGRAIWDDVLERGALSTAAQLLGLANRMLDLSVDYSSQRKQFGKPIGSFQAIKHHLANVAVQIEFARPVLLRAAYAVANRLPNRQMCVSHAKLVTSEAAWLAARNGIQVHGAMGYTWEMDLQIFMKRAWALNSAWGDRAFHKNRIAEAVLHEGALNGPGTTF